MKPNLAQLTKLHQTFRETPVLSLYLPVGQGGTQTRASWRLRADALLSDQRTAVSTSDSEGLDGFDRAHAIVVDALGEEGPMPSPGVWVLFATATDLLFSSVLDSPRPALARFGSGPVIAPLIGLAELRQRGAVAILDAKRARLFSVRGQELKEVADLLADRVLEEASHVGVAKRATTATGVRGQSGKDRAQRAWSAETLRFAKRIKDETLDAAGEGGFIVCGGAHRTVQAVSAELAGRDRVIQLPGLAVDMADQEIREAVARAVADLHEARGASALDGVEGSVGVHGHGCLGWNDTMRSLRNASVQTLLLARDLIFEDPDRAEQCVTTALEQGASVVEVSGVRGRSLLDEHDGVAAVLRYSTGVPKGSVAAS